MSTLTPPTEPPKALEHDVESVRAQLGGIVRELERRKHDAFDWRLHAKRNAGVLTFAGASLLTLTGGAAVLALLMARHRRKPAVRARAMKDAMSRAIAHPERVARPRAGILRHLVTTATLEVIAWSIHAAVTHARRVASQPRAVIPR